MYWTYAFCVPVQKPHVIKGKEVDCKKAVCKSQLPPPKKCQSKFQGGGGSWNGRGDCDYGFEGTYGGCC